MKIVINHKIRRLVSAFYLSAAMVFAGPVVADEKKYEGELILELQNDYAYTSDDPDNELNDTFGYAELATTFFVGNGLSLNTGFIWEGILENPHTRPGADRFFHGHGAYIDALNVQFELGENTSILGGKFAPSFGTAWDVTPGIYGVDFAEDYELTEQLGFAIGHNFATDSVGTILVTGNVFTADTTFMSNSVGARRGKTRKSDGGAGNTEDLDSFSATLDVGDIRSAEGLSLHAGFRHLSKGADSTNNENGYVAGFSYETPLSLDVTATVNGEIAHLSHAGGGADDITYYTAGLSLANGPWHLDLAGTQRHTDVSGGSDVKDELFQATLGYTDRHDIDWNAGYRFSEEGGVDTHILGIFITKTFGFEG